MTSEKDWDKMKRITCSVKILFNIRYKIPCDDRDFRKEDIRDSREQVLDKEHWKLLAPKEETLSLLIEERNFDQGTYEWLRKLPADLANVDTVIKEEDKALILLNSLTDEDYKTFILNQIYDK